MARLLELVFAQTPEAATLMQFAYEQLQEQVKRPAELRDAPPNDKVRQFFRREAAV